ncbi:MAG: hypothetical protein JRG80_14135, partial [Deltaproteobacteria bacterium]|nr:hypothetical protein [Deltaproteobacteria bacterium]
MACNRAEEFDLEVLFQEPETPECRAFVAHSGDCPDCTAAIQRHREPPPEITPAAPKVAVAGAAVVILAVIALLALSDRSNDAPESPAVEAEQRAMVAEDQAVR